MSWQFTVGVMAKGKAERIVVGAEDALIAALKVKAERPEAAIMYVRRLNDAVTRVTRPTSLLEVVDREWVHVRVRCSRLARATSVRRLN
jgi:hypothetical protein